jgi:hypothetical protein
MARRGRLYDEEALVCLNCPRGGATVVKRRPTSNQKRKQTARERQAYYAERGAAPRSCIWHRGELRRRPGGGWYCEVCHSEGQKQRYARRKARERAARQARKEESMAEKG